MGLTTFAGNQPTLKEAIVAKNYLNEKELRAMGQLVSGYLDFAERQAEREQAMTMQDWAEHLDRILTMSGEQLLIGNGSITHKQAVDAKLRRSSIEMEAITLENVYRIMENFSKLYAIISDEEKKSLVSYLIKEIQIYPNGTSDRILKSIEFNFPIYRDGREIRKLLWENGTTVEAVCLLTKE